MRLIIRGYAYEIRRRRGHKEFVAFKRFEEPLDVNALTLDEILPELAERHAASLVNDPLHMIEIEFPDEPDENQRFVRFGSSPVGMAMPVCWERVFRAGAGSQGKLDV